MNASQILPIILAAAPTMLTVLVGILVNDARLSDFRIDMNNRLTELRADMNTRFNEVDRRFDLMQDLWRSKLHRVEEVLDARLKHLEER